MYDVMWVKQDLKYYVVDVSRSHTIVSTGFMPEDLYLARDYAYQLNLTKYGKITADRILSGN